MAYTAVQLADLEAIKDAARLYSRGVDRLDPDTMKRAYWPEATDEHGVFNGNAWEFCDFCMTAHDAWRATMHCIFNHSVEFDDDRHARGEVYNVTYLYRADSTVLDTWHGRYLDEYEKRGDEWRIIRRVCVHEGSTSSESPGMDIGTDAFRQGTFDRPSLKRPVGP